MTKNHRDATLDGYEKSGGLWIDSTGNKLTYLPWCRDQPSNSMKARYLNWWVVGPDSCPDSKTFDDVLSNNPSSATCVKCSPKYLVPKGYSCLETDFGLVVIKAYNETTVTASEARNLCSADADYVHLTRGHQNMQYFFILYFLTLINIFVLLW